jgi:hypothetical protein
VKAEYDTGRLRGSEMAVAGRTCCNSRSLVTKQFSRPLATDASSQQGGAIKLCRKGHIRDTYDKGGASCQTHKLAEPNHLGGIVP